jgi:hypothetical protein
MVDTVLRTFPPIPIKPTPAEWLPIANNPSGINFGIIIQHVDFSRVLVTEVSLAVTLRPRGDVLTGNNGQGSSTRWHRVLVQPRFLVSRPTGGWDEKVGESAAAKTAHFRNVDAVSQLKFVLSGILTIPAHRTAGLIIEYAQEGNSLVRVEGGYYQFNQFGTAANLDIVEPESPINS